MFTMGGLKLSWYDTSGDTPPPDTVDETEDGEAELFGAFNSNLPPFTLVNALLANCKLLSSFVMSIIESLESESIL